ncbi:MAG TPA: T9SS type A sorting domain-containing protein, partial [Saprospiraceae bacterium]|nr:T9SS type A sorting domain-containing protein [Saprospiraceae bacterium]
NTAKEPIAIVTADHITGEVLRTEYKFNGIISSANDLLEANKSVMAYPNPTGDRLFIELQNLSWGEYEFSMFDAAGRSVMRRQVQFQVGAPAEIDVQSIRSGAYIYTLTDKGGQIRYAGRLVKQ